MNHIKADGIVVEPGDKILHIHGEWRILRQIVWKNGEVFFDSETLDGSFRNSIQAKFFMKIEKEKR